MVWLWEWAIPDGDVTRQKSRAMTHVLSVAVALGQHWLSVASGLLCAPLHPQL